ncbi:MAG TPA: hypothetical protein VLE23_03640 [Geminicoccaceae bacterium]|nr:hypothetical protein [Geminicoccaceae bacterium]
MDEVFAAIAGVAAAITLWGTGSLGKAVHVGYALSHWLGALIPA